MSRWSNVQTATKRKFSVFAVQCRVDPHCQAETRDHDFPCLDAKPVRFAVLGVAFLTKDTIQLLEANEACRIF